MGQVLPGSATTTEAVRRAIQHGQGSLRALSRRQPENDCQVAQAQVDGRSPNGSEGPKINLAVDRR